MTVLSLLGSVATHIDAPKGLWEWLLRLLSGAIPTYVWAIIVFTILLKVVLSPLDFFQKFKMKKNERLTKKLQPEMDKLARQYGDDKAALQQKQFQMQKAAGFSYFSACIPMLLTMVVFFTFFAGMRNISQYEEFKQYVNRYDIYITRYVELTGLNMDNTAATDAEDNVIIPSAEFDTLIENWWTDYNAQVQSGAIQSDESVEKAYNAYGAHENFKAFHDDYEARTNKRNFVVNNGILTFADAETYTIAGIKATDSTAYSPSFIYSYEPTTTAETIEFNRAVTNYLNGINSNLTQKDTDGLIGRINTLADFKKLRDDLSYYDLLESTYKPLILSVAESAAADRVYIDYKDKKPGFLWIKSIWAADVPWTDAVPEYSKFRSSTSAYMVNNKGGLDKSVLDEVQKKETYEKVMSKVLEDKSLSGANGYLILAILAVALSFLSQFISMRQQKKAGTAQTSNTTFKMMMYIMPLTIGVFAVISTAAFSVYMITNSIMTLLINMLTSFIVTQIYKKERQDEVNSAGVIKYGRKDPNDKK